MASDIDAWHLRQPAIVPFEPAAPTMIFAGVVRALIAVQSTQDIFEVVCRTCAEAGVVAVIVGRQPTGEWMLLIHRLTANMPPSLPLIDSGFELERAAFVPADRHPLARIVDDDALRYPCLTLPLSVGDRGATVLCLFAPGWRAEDIAVGEVFAAALTALLARSEAGRALQERQGRLQQRDRERRATLNGLAELGVTLATAADSAQALRRAAADARLLLGADVVAAELCGTDGHERAVDSRVALIADSQDALLDRLQRALIHASGRQHEHCRPVSPAPAEAQRTGLALVGEPALVLEAPLVWRGEARGVILAAFFQAPLAAREADRLLAVIAGQLGAALASLDAIVSERPALPDVLEHIRDGVLLFDSDRRLLLANPAAQALLGVLAPAALPATLVDLLTAARTEAVAGPRVFSSEWGDGRELSAVAFRLGARSAAVAVVVRDTTELAFMRQRLLETERTAALSQVVAGVAHELSSPLSAISGFAQLLLLGDLPEPARGHAGIVLDEADRALHIVQDLLASARRRPASRLPVNVNEIVERVLALRRHELRLHTIEVEWRPGRALPTCLCDPLQIQQVMLNLLTNAQQAIVAAQRPGCIELRTYAVDGVVSLEIADDGPGIPPALRERVFDPFFTTKPTGEGTGLGLTISFGIVEEHGGDLTIAASPQGGVLVTLSLPAASERPSDADRDTALAAPALRLLLAVDEESAASLVPILAALGHTVDGVADLGAALAALAAKPYDAVLADVAWLTVDDAVFWRRLNALRPLLRQRLVVVAPAEAPVPAFIEQRRLPLLRLPLDTEQVAAALRQVAPDGSRSA